MNTDSFIVSIKTDDIYKDLAEDSGKRFDTSNYELEKPLPKGKNKNVIGLMKDELRREMMTKFVGLRAKGYSQLIDDGYLMQSIRFVWFVSIETYAHRTSKDLVSDKEQIKCKNIMEWFKNS